MGWKDLLQQDEFVVLPWTGGRRLQLSQRSWTVDGPLPPEFGWYQFKVVGRKATYIGPADSDTNVLKYPTKGYLIGDRLIEDGASVNFDIKDIVKHSFPVYLLEPGLDRFSRIQAGKLYEDGPLVFQNLEMPLGPEEEVLTAFLEHKPSVNDIPNVYPALDAAFRMETFQRAEAERRRLELERRRREEEERQAKEERRRKLVEQLGDAVGRREMARVDFQEAARAALATGGATYLDHRTSVNRNEMVVRFRFRNRRFECVCDKETLRITDAGICLRGYDDDYEVEEVGDTRFTLESLPSVIGEAIDTGVLHVFRHA